MRGWLEKRLNPEQKARLGSLARLFRSSRPSLAEGCDLPNRILIGTHHKTGSAWMDSIFRDACRFHGLNYFSGDQAEMSPEVEIFLQTHSQFEFDSLREPLRGLHIIRDPRDVIVSGCFYHQSSKETWLHQPSKNLEGLTYQEKMNGYGSLEEQLMFEMENVGRNTILAMKDWNYAMPSFFEIKYEDLIGDESLKLFHQIFLFLGFPGSAIPGLLAIAYNNSLFSGRVAQSVHVRSGRSAQWRRYFSEAHKRRFLEIFGDTLIELGYEQDDDWSVEQLASPE